MWRLIYEMDRKTATPDAIIAEIAARQHGVVATDQLRRAGIGEGAISARLGAGRLHHVHRGVYAVGHSALSPQGRLLAAVLAVGGGARRRSSEDSVLEYWGAAVSHRSAAWLWGLLPMALGPVDIVVAGTGGKVKRSGIRIHRSRSLAPSDITLRTGIPVTDPARTIVNLRRATAARVAGALSPRELRRAIRQANVLGLPIGDESRVDRTRSDLERDFLRLCRRHRLPPPEVNVRIGRYLVDFLWRNERLVVETDSYLYHRGKVAFQDDRDRDLELRRLGYEMVRLSERQVNEKPDRVAGVLSARLEQRRSRLPAGGGAE